MQYRRLGRSDLTVSRIGLGCEQLGGTDWGPHDRSAAVAAVHRALDLGVTFFDTADVYGLGESERVLSEALGEERRRVVISSKFGVRWADADDGGRARTWKDSSPEWLEQALEDSLRRLRIDCLPLYFIHWPDLRTPIEDVIAALEACRRKGKIRHYGLSNHSVPAIRAAIHGGSPAALQFSFNLLAQHEPKALLGFCEKAGLGAMTYGSLAQGLLSGKYDAGSAFGQDDRRHRLPHFHGSELSRSLTVVENLRTVARRHGKTCAQLALGWVLGHDAVTTALVGARTPAQVEQNTSVFDRILTPDQLVEIAPGTMTCSR